MPQPVSGWGGLAVPASRGALDSSQGVGALVMVRSGSTIHFVTQDPFGNVAGLVNAADGILHARFEYSPFGELLQAAKLVNSAAATAAAACPIRFSNQYWDSESGLSYYGYRYYSPALGRWINRDPIGESGGLNLYGFVRNRPVNRVDKLGLAESNLATLLRELAQKPGYLLGRLIWDDEEMDYVRVPYTVWPENQARWMTVPVPAENAGYDKFEAGIESFGLWGETATYAMLPMGRLGKLGGAEGRAAGVVENQELKCICEKLESTTVGRSNIRWIDERAAMDDAARMYDDGAAGARSSVKSRARQVPVIEGIGGNVVRFDGLDGVVLIDRKTAITTFPKAKRQALRQSLALQANGLTARWEVPTQLEACRALKMLQELGIKNVTVVVVAR